MQRGTVIWTGTGRRRTRVAAWVLCAVVAAGLFWRWHRAPRDSPADGSATSVAKGSAPAGRDLTVARLGATRLVAPTPNCAGGWIDPTAGNAAAVGAGEASRPRVGEVGTRLVERLDRSGEPASRAAALVVAMLAAEARRNAAAPDNEPPCDESAQGVSAQPAPTEVGSPNPAAPADAGARCRAEQAAHGVAAVLTPPDAEGYALQQQLARMALDGADPTVYGTALAVCDHARANGACGLLTNARWAQLDPQNAAPWIHLLDEAQARHDEAAALEAMYRVGVATRNEPASGEVTRRIFGAFSEAERDQLANLDIAFAVTGWNLAQVLLPYQNLNGRCSDTALRDANRRQLCGLVAESLTSRPATLIELQVGGQLGTRLGWPDSRLDALRGEAHAFMTAHAEEVMTPEFLAGVPAVSFSCADAGRVAAAMRDVAIAGEIGAMRRWAERSGRSSADWARLGQAQRLAAAASAPS